MATPETSLLTDRLDGSAGSRDAPLTNHGVLQAKRLGNHLAKRRDAIGRIEKIFTSNLQRAYRTAEAIAEAQSSLASSSSSSSSTSEASLRVVQLPELREKDFGSSEGVKFGAARPSGSNGDAQSDSETRDSMKSRIDRFLDAHLAPAVDAYASQNVAVVIVAHGIILGVLLRALLSRYPSKQLDSLYKHGEILAAWSNTGVLQAKIELSGQGRPEGSNTEGTEPSNNKGGTSPEPARARAAPGMVVQFTNNVDHLQGLKKTRGGIGSAKFDSKQKTMDSFFGPASKKRKLDEGGG
ncbi:hypothetical protein SLS62_002317 [Diatrype stigma]|uniref:Phosphoglycerate mutase-like protein n=1 Tax=Diatrype stigma TaxID=117547 RepID=A0AAN9YSH3_9PEZI